MRNVASMLACGALVVCLGLSACGGASTGTSNEAPAQDSSTAETAQTIEEAEDVETTDDGSGTAAEGSALDGWYDDYAHQLESSRDDYLVALGDYESWPSELAEALNVQLDQDQEHMTTNLNEIYDFGASSFDGVVAQGNATEEEAQAYKDRLAELRDECIAVIEQKIAELRA